MGGIKNIGSAIGSVIKSVAPSILKAVAPAATSLLSKITDGFVGKASDFLKTALGKTSLPSPLKSLANKLIGQGADMLKKLGGDFIEKGLTKLMSMVTGRSVDGQNVNVPAFPDRQTAIQNNPAVPNSANTGSSSSAATGSTGASGSASNPNLPPNPKSFGDLADNNNMQALLAARDAYQNARQAMMDQAKYMSDLMKASQETLKAIGQNVGR